MVRGRTGKLEDEHHLFRISGSEPLVGCIPNRVAEGADLIKDLGILFTSEQENHLVVGTGSLKVGKDLNAFYRRCFRIAFDHLADLGRHVRALSKLEPVKQDSCAAGRFVVRTIFRSLDLSQDFRSHRPELEFGGLPDRRLPVPQPAYRIGHPILRLPISHGGNRAGDRNKQATHWNHWRSG